MSAASSTTCCRAPSARDPRRPRPARGPRRARRRARGVAAARNPDVLAEQYDAVWVYGDPTIYDPVTEYGFGAEVAAKTA